MDSEQYYERIIELLEYLVLKSQEPQGEDIQDWVCQCGFKNIGLTSQARKCVICESVEPLRIEAKTTTARKR